MSAINNYSTTSWKNEMVREGLRSYLHNNLKQRHQALIDEEKYRVQSLEQSIREMTRNLKTHHDSLIRARKTIEQNELDITNITNKVEKELEMLARSERVKDVEVTNTGYRIHTYPIYCYHDKEPDERYYIGNFTIDIKPDRTSVKFHGDNPRRSYWSSNDPHPHIGHDGNACLGNISATIAELCSQMELYALAMVCIDFLESVNTDDPAGANITHWDRVDEEGNIIEQGHPDEPEVHFTCESCDETFYEGDGEDVYTVYRSYRGARDGQGDWGTERYVCHDCRHEYYPYIEDLDEYVEDCVFEDEEEEQEEPMEQSVVEDVVRYVTPVDEIMDEIMYRRQNVNERMN